MNERGSESIQWAKHLTTHARTHAQTHAPTRKSRLLVQVPTQADGPHARTLWREGGETRALLQSVRQSVSARVRVG